MNPGIYGVRILRRLNGHRNTKAYLAAMRKTGTVLKQSSQLMLMNLGNFSESGYFYSEVLLCRYEEDADSIDAKEFLNSYTRAVRASDYQGTGYHLVTTTQRIMQMPTFYGVNSRIQRAPMSAWSNYLPET